LDFTAQQPLLLPYSSSCPHPVMPNTKPCTMVYINTFFKSTVHTQRGTQPARISRPVDCRRKLCIAKRWRGEETRALCVPVNIKPVPGPNAGVHCWQHSNSILYPCSACFSCCPPCLALLSVPSSAIRLAWHCACSLPCIACPAAALHCLLPDTMHCSACFAPSSCHCLLSQFNSAPSIFRHMPSSPRPVCSIPASRLPYASQMPCFPSRCLLFLNACLNLCLPSHSLSAAVTRR
jgi:hypothetical protein